MGSIGDLSPGGSLAIGILVGLLSTGVQSLGITLQRKSHILEDEKGPHDIRRPPHRRRRWQIGMGMFIVSNLLGSTVQISTLPLPVLSTLQASGLVFNSICASLILGEPFTSWSIGGTLLVCTGALLIAIFGAIPSPAHTLDELLVLLGRTPFVVWMCFQGVLVLAVAVTTDTLNHIFKKLSQNPRIRLGRGLAYGCISGILSAHSLLVAKSAVELVIKTLTGGSNQFVHWQSWVLLIALVTLALTQLYYLHRGLKLVSTSVLYPLVFCIYNIIAILDGLIYFDQVNKLSLRSALLISLGTVILLSGVLALSWRLSDEQHPPSVGQSTLAPGLGLVEDTDGEEDDEEGLLLGSDFGHVGDEDDVLPSNNYTTYQTFGSESRPSLIASGDRSRPSSLHITPPRKKPSYSSKRTSWAERVEIWGDLEDLDRPPASPKVSRSRSQTLPSLGGGGGGTADLAPRRGFSSGSPSGVGGGGGVVEAVEDAGEDADTEGQQARVRFRRRRRSTGFPGFHARKTRRKSSGGLQDAINGLWRNRWWNRPSGSKGNSPDAAHEGDDVSAFARYRDDPDDDEGGPSVSSPSSSRRPEPSGNEPSV